MATLISANANAQILTGGFGMPFTSMMGSPAANSAYNLNIAVINQTSAALAAHSVMSSAQLASQSAAMNAHVANQQAINFGQTTLHQGAANNVAIALRASDAHAANSNAFNQAVIDSNRQFDLDRQAIDRQMAEESAAAVRASEEAASKARREEAAAKARAAEAASAAIASAEASGGLAPFGPFGGMGVGMFGGGFGGGNLLAGGGGYQSISWGMGLGAFSQAHVGTFNSWGGSDVTTLTPPQVSFSNFGSELNNVSTVPLFGAASVSTFSAGTNPTGAITAIGASAANPWAVQAASDALTYEGFTGTTFRAGQSEQFLNGSPYARHVDQNFRESENIEDRRSLPIEANTAAQDKEALAKHTERLGTEMLYDDRAPNTALGAPLYGPQGPSTMDRLRNTFSDVTQTVQDWWNPPSQPAKAPAYNPSSDDNSLSSPIGGQG